MTIFSLCLVNLKCTDNGTPPYSINTQLNIPVSDVNEAPTDITIDGKSTINVKENAINGTIIGTLGCTDPDKDDKFTYTLLGNSTKFFKVGECSNIAFYIPKHYMYRIT